MVVELVLRRFGDMVGDWIWGEACGNGGGIGFGVELVEMGGTMVLVYPVPIPLHLRFKPIVNQTPRYSSFLPHKASRMQYAPGVESYDLEPKRRTVSAYHYSTAAAIPRWRNPRGLSP